MLFILRPFDIAELRTPLSDELITCGVSMGGGNGVRYKSPVRHVNTIQ